MIQLIVAFTVALFGLLLKVKPPSPPYLGPAANYRKGGNRPIWRITVHCTVSPCVPGGARNIARMFRTTSRDASAHYCADPKESVQIVWDSDTAYHAPPNEGSIGYELCCTLADEGRGHWKRRDHEAMLRIAAADIARLCLVEGIPIRMIGPGRLRRRVKGMSDHDDVSKAWGQTVHWDCGPYFPRRRFARMVRRAARDLQDGKRPPAPEPVPEPSQAERRRRQREAAQERRRRRRQIARGQRPANRVEQAKALLRLAFNQSRQKGWDERQSRLREALRILHRILKGR